MGLKEVFKKVSAINGVTELASEKIELASIAELQKAIADGKKEIDFFKKVQSDEKALFSELENRKKTFLEQINVYETALSQKMDVLFKTYSDLDKKAKEIGISIKDNPIYKEAGGIYNKLNSLRGDISSLKNKLGSKF